MDKTDCLRMDEVGRILIPENMRKLLNIDEERIVEIYVEKDKLIIKKYNPLKDNYNFISNITKILANCFSCECIVGSKEKVIAVSSQILKPMENKKVSKEFTQIISAKCPMIANKKQIARQIDITESYNVEYNSIAICDIERDFGKLGFICLISFEENKNFSGEDLQLLKIAREIIVSSLIKND